MVESQLTDLIHRVPVQFIEVELKFMIADIDQGVKGHGDYTAGRVPADIAESFYLLQEYIIQTSSFF